MGGVFGTGAERFCKSALNAQVEGSQDAGRYDVAVPKGGDEAARAVFQSNTARFKNDRGSDGQGGFGDQYSVPPKNRIGPGPADYINDKEVNYRSPFRTPKRDHLSFGSGRTRFDAKEIFHGGQYNLNPGPGDYNGDFHPGVSGSADVRDRRNLAPTVGSTNPTVGPGSYETRSTLLKKTYNVSTEQPIDVAARLLGVA